MLELIPFAESECLVCVFLGPKGRWFLLNQISRLVFGWDTRVFKRKILYNAMTTKNKYRIIKVSDSYLLEQLKAINMVDRESKQVHLIHVASLDSFIKSYSRRLSLFTKLYDTVHRLQWGNSSNNYEEYGTYTKSSKTAKRKRTLTMADKKYVASLQNWLCAWCAETLPARFEVDHIMQFAEGGSDDVENLQALCPNCHAVKTEMDRRVQRQQDEYETTALLYEDDENNNTNRSFKAPAKRSAVPLLGNKKQSTRPNIARGPVRMTQSQKQDSDDEEIGFADILVNDEDEEDDDDDTLTRVTKKAKTSPDDSPVASSKNGNAQKSQREAITSSFFGKHVAAARKISNPPNRLQQSQSQEIMNDYDKDEESSDEDLVLPRHMQDDDDEDSDDQSPDPRFEKSFIAPSSNNAKSNDNKTNGKSNGSNVNKSYSTNNSKNNSSSQVKGKARSNPFEADLDEPTQILTDKDLSSDNNNRSNYDEDEEMNDDDDNNDDNNNESQVRSDNDNDIVDDEGDEDNEDNNDNNTSGERNNNGDNNDDEDDQSDSDQDLFASQNPVKVVSTKTGEWTNISPHFAAKELANPKTRHLQTLKVNQSLALNALKHRVMNSNVPDKNSVLGNNPIKTTPEKTASTTSKKKSTTKTKETKAVAKPKKKITDAALKYEKMLKERQKKK